MRSFSFLVVALCMATAAVAQPVVGGFIPSVNFGAHVNLTNANFPGPSINGTTAFKDVYGPGFGGGVHLDVNFAMLSLRLSGDYLRFSPDNAKYQQGLQDLIGSAAAQFTIEGGGITMWSGNLNAKMAILPLPIIKPYLTGGFGFASLNADGAKVMQNGAETKAYPGFSSETKTMWNAGAGVDFSIGVTLFLEVKYVWVMTEPETSTLVPVTIGITF
jgi:opacity protein-like surface antigen